MCIKNKGVRKGGWVGGGGSEWMEDVCAREEGGSESRRGG